MRKIVFPIMLTLLTLCMELHAQDYVRYSGVAGCKNLIIRSFPEYSTYNEVIYSRDPVLGQGYIELWVEGVGTCRIAVQQGYEVRDMKVYTNLLYFCGKHGSCGFIAVLDLNDMYTHITNTSVNAAISYTDLDANYVSSLEKLVVYGNSGAPPTYPSQYANEHIAAIGRRGSLISREWVAVHLKYNNLFLGTGISSSVNVVVDVIEDFSCPHDEQIQEVLLTDAYVAYVRYRQSTEEYIIHRCDKYNILGTYGIKYRYNAPPNEVISAVKGVAMEDNHIALATVAADADFSGTYEIRVRNIDLLTMQMVSSQLIPVDVLKQDIEITYKKNQQKIVLTVDFPLGTGGPGVYLLAEIDPMPVYQTNGPNYYYYFSYVMHDHCGCTFYSLDDAAGSYIVAMSDDIWMRKKMSFYNSNNSFGNNTCYYSSFIFPNPLQDLVPIDDGSAIHPYDCSKYAVRQEVRIGDIETNIECIIDEEQTEVQLNE